MCSHRSKLFPLRAALFFIGLCFQASKYDVTKINMMEIDGRVFMHLILYSLVPRIGLILFFVFIKLLL